MRKKKIVAGALGAILGWAGAGGAQEAPRPFPADPGLPAAALPAPSHNQRMANAIAGYLQASGQFKGTRLEVAFVDGLAELSGEVNTLAQRAEAIRIARTIPGVAMVRDRLSVAGMVMPSQALEPGPGPAPVPGLGIPPGFGPAPGFGPPPGFSSAGVGPGPALGPLPGLVGGPAPGKEGAEVPGTGLPEPLSIMPVPPIPNTAYMPPPMPPYAWPTYAPYNNLSRVAYPKLYPHEAWPYIGPMYPFPKVPPGWRGVSLRWQDGHWWYGREATGHDWWRVRYW